MTHIQLKAALAAHRAAKGIVTIETDKVSAAGMLLGRIVGAVTTTYENININKEDGVIDRFMTGYDIQREGVDLSLIK